MNDINCNACEELTEHAPCFVDEGVTDEICGSLQNDTGLNPDATVVHTDCEDLNLANDCLVGRMDGEVDKEDACDWRPFAHKIIPNLYNMYKAVICAICGLWDNVHRLWDNVNMLWSRLRAVEDEIQRIWAKIAEFDFDALWEEIRKLWAKVNLIDTDAIWAEINRIWNAINNIDLSSIQSEITRIWTKLNSIDLNAVWDEINRIWAAINDIDIIGTNERIDDLCNLVNQSMTKNLNIYGMNIGGAISSQSDRSGGEIMSKNGTPAAAPRTSVGDYDSLGIEYLKRRYKGCDADTSKTYEWIMPRFHCYTLASNYELGDVVWRVSKTKCAEWGMTNHLWNTLEQYPQWWRGFGNSVGNMMEFTLRLDISGNYLRLAVIGADAAPAGAYIDSTPNTPILYIS